MAAARLQLVIVVYVVVVVSSCHVVVDAVDNGQKSILQGHAQEFSLGAKTKWLKIKAKCREWRGVLGGQQAPSPPAMGLRECCELPSAVRGRAPTAQRFSTIFSTPGGLSRHCDIVNNCGLSCSHWEVWGQDPHATPCVHPCHHLCQSMYYQT